MVEKLKGLMFKCLSEVVLSAKIPREDGAGVLSVSSTIE
jgi:hypothetical protein